MLDTVKLISPAVGERQAARVEQNCKRKQQLDLATGAFDYEITTGSLGGSWDERVSVRVEREVEARLVKRRGREVMEKTERPFLVVEGSVHKALMGHNVYGGPTDWLSAVRWLISDLAGRLWIDLPNADCWTVVKADWAEVYDLGTWEGAQEYMLGLTRADFPRRVVARFGDESLHSNGSTTTVKVYRKGPEFLAHDNKRLKGRIDDRELFGLQSRAAGLLRVEVSIKSRKLKADFGEKPSVVQVTNTYLTGVHDREAARLLREGKLDMETVRTHLEVSSRLRAIYNRRLANTLFGTWMQLSALGEDVVKKYMHKATFYRQRKQLVDAGCSWQAANVKIVPQLSAIPAGFSPVRSDPRRLVEEAPTVARQLAPFRMVA